MSMELFVILALSRAPDAEAWQGALRRQHIPVEITKKVDLNRQTGFMPLLVTGQQSGIFFHKDSYAELSSTYGRLANIGIEQPTVYALGYGGDLYECAAAFYAAAALVAEFDGKAFEPQGGVFMSREELIEAGDLCVRETKR